jgi:hypothetical protein
VVCVVFCCAGHIAVLKAADAGGRLEQLVLGVIAAPQHQPCRFRRRARSMRPPCVALGWRLHPRTIDDSAVFATKRASRTAPSASLNV